MVIAAILLISIVAGTVWVFASPNSRRNLRGPSPESVQALDKNGETAIFAELGLLRLSTSDSPSLTVVISPFFPYPVTDLAFREELVRKTGSLRSVFTGWFGSHTASEIKALGEKELKKQLLDKMNSYLVLGQITTLYFEEYIIFE